MNTITRGEVGRKAALTATILAVVAFGLAGCQTAEADRTTEDQVSVAEQTARSNAASQARYEGLAEYWEKRLRAADSQPAVMPVPVVADRLEQAVEQSPAVLPAPVVADRLEHAVEQDRAVMPVPVVADRLESRE